jgi:HAD superfamily hydrolase (TIGR01509 family)
VLAIARHTAVGVLTNNGKLMVEAVRNICSPLFPLCEGRILCSGALGVRKPDAEIYRRALTHFECMPHETLFVDDLFVNVQGARAVGLHAETVTDASSLGAVLKRYRLV